MLAAVKIIALAIASSGQTEPTLLTRFDGSGLDVDRLGPYVNHQRGLDYRHRTLALDDRLIMLKNPRTKAGIFLTVDVDEDGYPIAGTKGFLRPESDFEISSKATAKERFRPWFANVGAGFFIPVQVVDTFDPKTKRRKRFVLATFQSPSKTHWKEIPRWFFAIGESDRVFCEDAGAMTLIVAVVSPKGIATRYKLQFTPYQVLAKKLPTENLPLHLENNAITRGFSYDPASGRGIEWDRNWPPKFFEIFDCKMQTSQRIALEPKSELNNGFVAGRLFRWSRKLPGLVEEVDTRNGTTKWSLSERLLSFAPDGKSFATYENATKSLKVYKIPDMPSSSK